MSTLTDAVYEDWVMSVADQAMSKLDELLPWNWDNPKLDAVAA